MCGVFGFVARDPEQRPSLKTLKAIATRTETRGRHAWGMAWVDARGRLRAYKNVGRVTDDFEALAMARDAVAMIGHCRWATNGSPENNLHNHPHPCDGGWMIHNGVVSGWQDMVQRYDLNLMSECDSEAIARMVEHFDGTLLERWAAAAGEADASPLVTMGLWARPARLLVARNGNPLHVGWSDRGLYFGSLMGGLPCNGRKPMVFNNGQAAMFRVPTAESHAAVDRPRMIAIPGRTVAPASKRSVTGSAGARSAAPEDTAATTPAPSDASRVSAGARLAQRPVRQYDLPHRGRPGRSLGPAKRRTS